MVRSQPQPAPQVSDQGILAGGERCVFTPSPAGEGIWTLVWSVQSKRSTEILGKEARIFLQQFCCLLNCFFSSNISFGAQWNVAHGVEQNAERCPFQQLSFNLLHQQVGWKSPFMWTRREHLPSLLQPPALSLELFTHGWEVGRRWRQVNPETVVLKGARRSHRDLFPYSSRDPILHTPASWEIYLTTVPSTVTQSVCWLKEKRWTYKYLREDSLLLHLLISEHRIPD